MVALADILRAAGPVYLEQHSDQLLPSQSRAIRDILNCRTPSLGGQLFRCPECNEVRAVYFSCRNRHCPQCQVSHADEWLERQRALLLPTSYLLVTCTLPNELRDLARSHQRVVYSILMRSAAQALQDVVADPRFIGGRTAILAVLHTWTRALLFHPHVHMLVPAGGLVQDGDELVWRMPRKKAFPVPSFAIAHRFRERLHDALVDAGLVSGSETVFRRRWVANVIKVGSGEKALLYLSRYVFRTAIADERIDDFDGDHVTFHWRESATGILRFQTLDVDSFITRFLAHVLPRGFTRVRYYGLWAPVSRKALNAAHEIIEAYNLAIGRKPLELPKPRVRFLRTASPRCPVCASLYGEPVCQLPRQRAPP